MPAKKASKRKSETEAKEPEKKPKVEKEKKERRRSETKVEVDGTIETHTTLSPKTPPGDPPEPEELIKVITKSYFFNTLFSRYSKNIYVNFILPVFVTESHRFKCDLAHMSYTSLIGICKCVILILS